MIAVRMVAIPPEAIPTQRVFIIEQWEKTLIFWTAFGSEAKQCSPCLQKGVLPSGTLQRRRREASSIPWAYSLTCDQSSPGSENSGKQKACLCCLHLSQRSWASSQMFGQCIDGETGQKAESKHPLLTLFSFENPQKERKMSQACSKFPLTISFQFPNI